LKIDPPEAEWMSLRSVLSIIDPLARTLDREQGERALNIKSLQNSENIPIQFY
jgi:hypothetical protein